MEVDNTQSNESSVKNSSASLEAESKNDISASGKRGSNNSNLSATSEKSPNKGIFFLNNNYKKKIINKYIYLLFILIIFYYLYTICFNIYYNYNNKIFSFLMN